MEFVVLGLLMIRGMTIYELNQSFRQGISLFYSASYGSLQTSLKKLLAKGWATYSEETAQGRNKKVYAITAEGQAAFMAWMNGEADESKLEVTALSKLYFLGLIQDKAMAKGILADLVAKMEAMERQLAGLEKELERQPVPVEYEPIMKFQMKTLSYGIGAHGFASKWFKGLLDEQ
ncbi:PadR family transcriptional regulator [Paenibacillus sp. PAMC21692]|uniref:PadR family transcriptional regulator n=1 Tax=Paenibacillus sp. PAMC21692 TaxID=2762320 RepID=UPI00164E3EE0|nr:PadR family transcriptional regulator [Paenibacillus sp. PAMC21692]QNK57578.1 PadR family transcriptional regulator [Paenibacillus sp. PAMC21692]